jgi:4-alpha-glucanotransferase
VTELDSLNALASHRGVHLSYRDGLGREVTPGPDTLMAVLRALGTPLEGPADAARTLRAIREEEASALLPPVLVAWDGTLPDFHIPATACSLVAEDGEEVPLQQTEEGVRAVESLPNGYHRLTAECHGRLAEATVIAAPVEAYLRPGSRPSWGVSAHVAALRSSRSRSVGDLRDLERLCTWIGRHGGDLVSVLPLLPTFNDGDPEPSPYSPVTRLFWSELLLDLGDAIPGVAPAARLDVVAAEREAIAALAGLEIPDAARRDPTLLRYARFRGAQARLGRNWSAWPDGARSGTLRPDQVDPDVERFHLVAQCLVREQLDGFRSRAEAAAIRIGLDLAVGVHPDGFDTWDNPGLFADGVAVGAPPDPGFPSGQDWGFPPVLPAASRREGHRYFAASIAHQCSLAGVLRLDHVMSLSRLYWIPRGMDLDQGTYLSYPLEELLAVVTLESARHRTEIVGENLGTVPPEIDTALPRHRIRGMYVAQLAALSGESVAEPGPSDAAMIGTHDMPTLAGWLAGRDIDERLRHGLVAVEDEDAAREARARAVGRLAERLGAPADDPPAMLDAMLDWLGGSSAPMVLPWLEDLWLEERGVNMPGTRSSEAPNWQRPMARLLDEVVEDPVILARLARLRQARDGAG